MVNRTRLMALLPLSVELDWFRLGGFDMVFGASLSSKGGGTEPASMYCGGETYAQHPPSVQSLPRNCFLLAQRLPLGSSGPIGGSNITFDGLLSLLARNATSITSAAASNKLKGQEELIRRMEAGLFVRGKWV
ncbi:unnamed protein product [Polarella glacialis]|uniref:Uncharacterized protein n=1 Tax=Polarella glacialis TaxID=89957 RepID=A0A813HNY9_POLGL|nr:unnamed protein product [Polarella glacialis]